MISSTTDQKDAGGGRDGIAKNEGGAKIEDDDLVAWLMCSDEVLEEESEEENDNISLDIPLDPLFFYLEEEENEISSKKGKQVAGDVSINDSSTFPLPLPLDSKKRKEGPVTETVSAETPTKIRRCHPPGSGSGSKKRK
ncbi:unnamed protein product [Vicia faba]|uniref:Uncharacterized protein n=1 Tax=Vicia faba TaxID=3906 RepID=A0AAV0ZCT4_VICFA|nr:unnamed protein product [Vicia faba]